MFLLKPEITQANSYILITNTIINLLVIFKKIYKKIEVPKYFN